MSDWRDKAAFMREVGATHATWDENAHLSSLTLAPPAAERAPGPAARMMSLQERVAASEAAELKRRHDVLFAASTVKPKLVTPDPPPSVVPRAVRAKEAAEARAEAKR